MTIGTTGRKILLISCLALLLSCSWQPHIGVCMPGDHTEDAKAAVMFTKTIQGSDWSISYHDQIQIALTKRWSIFEDWLDFNAGVSYLTHRTPVATQLNARVGFDAGPIVITHDSNGDLNPETNTGINCGYIKI